jgi:hypothetical protein
MCLRPDIVYVVSRAVYATYLMLEHQGLHGHSVGFYTHCEAAEADAVAQGDESRAEIWRQVLDFGTRHCCSPLSAVELAGEPAGATLYESPMTVAAGDRVRVHIGNPRNPPHVPGQQAVTPASMRPVNAGWEPARS